MKAHGVAQPFPGPKLYQQRAEQALPILVRQAHSQRDITYEDLAREMGMANPRNLNFVLGSVGFTLRRAAMELGYDVPAIQTIVVNKATRLPGSGGQWFAAGDGYDKLDDRTRREIIKKRHQAVFTYTRWHDVLRHLKLPEVDESKRKLLEDAARSGRGSGESAQHRALKMEVLRKPGLAGLPAISGSIEYRLPSGDALDVCFEDEQRLVAVEVKSRLSSIADVTRGLFQVVKYVAVMEAMVAFRRSKQRVSAVLLVEGRLPVELLPLHNSLGVRVVELKRL